MSVKSSSEIDVCLNGSPEPENVTRTFFEINRNFIQTVEFIDLTTEWIKSKQNHRDLKILRIEKCPSFEALSLRLILLDFSLINSLFMLVVEITEEIVAATESKLNFMKKIFLDDRPVFLQLNSPDGKNRLFVKNYLETKISNLSVLETVDSTDTQELKKILKAHGRIDGNILTAQLSVIEKSSLTKRIAGSVLCLRFVNLFVGGCDRLIPWLTACVVPKLNNLQAFLAYNDYPFEPKAAVQLSWDLRNFDILKVLITQDCSFPNDFYMQRVPPRLRDGFRRTVQQRQQLHRSIAEGNKEEVLKILNEIEEICTLKKVFNQFNESAMATVLQNFNAHIYELLLQRNVQFCEKSVQLMKNLSEDTRKIISDANEKYAKPLNEVAGKHRLLSKCFLATGHSNRDFYSEKINGFLWDLQANPETFPLLQIAEKCVQLKIVFDFKHIFTGMMIPKYINLINCRGLCCLTGILYIAARSSDSEVKGTLAHELAHLAMQLLYRNDFKPFSRFDVEREQEYREVIQECTKIYEKKEIVPIRTINRAFDWEGYTDSEAIARELIVRVPQIIAEHSKRDVEAAQAKYPKLFAYYLKYIPSDIDAAFATNNLNQEFFGINKNFIQSVDFKDLTEKWTDSKTSDNDLKILRIKKCENIKAVSDLFQKLNLGVVNNLFVFVLELLTEIKPTALQIYQFSRTFKDYRPMIVQIDAPNSSKTVYVQENRGVYFYDFSLKDFLPHSSVLTALLENYGCFEDDILTTKICQITKESIFSSALAASVLCLRFMNLFVGGCNRIMPWLRCDRVLSLNHIKTYFAFIDYPFEVVPAVELAWQMKRFDLMATFIERDCQFPKNINILQMWSYATVEFKKSLDLRRDLHQNIVNQNVEEVSKFLNKFDQSKRLKRAYSENNESVMATCLRNFNADVYELLLRNKFKFCEKYEQIVTDLPQEAKKTIAVKNMQFSTPLTAIVKDHPLTAKCWLTTGHFNQDFYKRMINNLLSQLEKVPETKQLLELAQKCPQLKIVFDFKHDFVNIMDPTVTVKRSSILDRDSFVIKISAKSLDLSLGRFTRGLTQLAMHMLYANNVNPFRKEDTGRCQEFEQIVAECRLVSGNSWVVRRITSVLEFFGSDEIMGELIAQVPDILCEWILHFKSEVEKFKMQCPELFDYYSKYIVPDIDLALKDGRLAAKR